MAPVPPFDRRSKFRVGLHAVYQPLYDALCEDLSDAWQPVSGFRTFSEQQVLYSQGRDTPGEIVTNSRPGYSFHQYGLASDWGYFPSGIYVPLVKEDAIWNEYIDVCKKVGVRCLDWERPHNELNASFKTSDLLLAYNRGGLGALDRLIKGEVA